VHIEDLRDELLHQGSCSGLLSAVPVGGFINNCLQTTLGNLRDFEANVVAKVVWDWLVIPSHLRELGMRLQNLDQAGNGRYPT
jgi:hypothetical protein